MKLTLVLAVVFVLMSDFVWAAPVGQAETHVLGNIIEGNVGLLLGLAIAMWGFWVWIVKQNTWGFFMMVLGTAITAFPGMFEGLRVGAASFVGGMGGTTTTNVEGAITQ